MSKNHTRNTYNSDNHHKIDSNVRHNPTANKRPKRNRYTRTPIENSIATLKQDKIVYCRLLYTPYVIIGDYHKMRIAFTRVFPLNR